MIQRRGHDECHQLKLAAASFDVEQVWTDERPFFSVQDLVAR